MDPISQEVTLVAISTIFFLLLAVGIIVLILVYQKKQLQYIVQKRELETKFEKELMSVQLETQEHTLNLVGLEIHDNVGQALSLVKLNLNRLSEQIPAMPIMQSTKDLVSKAIQDLRILSKTLNSNFIAKNSLADCLAFDLAMVQQSGAMETTLNIQGDDIDIPDQTKLIVYRMAQELLNNVVKHSGATAVQVNINYANNQLQLGIQDNGNGLLSEANQAPIGTGLGNLFIRAKMINADFSISNASPQGVVAQLTVPLNSPSR